METQQQPSSPAKETSSASPGSFSSLSSSKATTSPPSSLFTAPSASNFSTVSSELEWGKEVLVAVGAAKTTYLQLSVTVLAAFFRVPETSASNEMVSKIPLILEALSNESGPAVLEECYEFLYLVSTASEDGITKLYS